MGETDATGRRPQVIATAMRQYVIYACLVGGVCFVLTHRVDLRGISQAQLLEVWIPLGFGLESALVLALAARFPSRLRQLVLSADFLAWLAPLAVLLTTRLGSTGLAIWLTLAIGSKLAVGLWVLGQAVRAGVSNHAAAGAFAGLALFFSLLTLPTVRAVSGSHVQLTGDEPHYVTVTASLLRDHDFAVDDEYTDGTFVQIYGGPATRNGSGHAVPTSGGRDAPAHDLGLPVLAVPFYAAGGVLGVVIGMAVAASLLVREVFFVLCLAGVRRGVAVATTAFTAFSLPVVAYATQVMTEIPLALCVAVVLRALLAPSSRWASVSAGLALGVLPWLHVRSWLLLLPLLLTGCFVWTRWRDRFALVTPVVLLTCAYGVVIASVYGRIAPSPLFFVVGGDGPYQPSVPNLHAVVVALEDPWLNWSFGLLLVSPVYVLGLAGSLVLVRKGRVGLGVATTTVAYTVFLSVMEFWGVGQAWAPPGRFMVACIPLLAVPIGLAVERLVDRGWTQLVTPLLAWAGACAFVTLTSLPVAYTPGPVAYLASVLHVPSPYGLITGKAPYALGAVVAAVVVGVALLIGRAAPGSTEPEPDTEPLGIATPASSTGRG